MCRGDTAAAEGKIYIALEADSHDEASRVFDALSAGGKVEMPLQKTEWAEKYGICADRFGIQWMVSYTGAVQFGGSPQG